MRLFILAVSIDEDEVNLIPVALDVGMNISTAAATPVIQQRIIIVSLNALILKPSVYKQYTKIENNELFSIILTLHYHCLVVSKL